MSEVETEKERLGISSFFPPMAAEILVHASEAARTMPFDGLRRKKVIQDAIDKVRLMYPEKFKPADEDCA